MSDPVVIIFFIVLGIGFILVSSKLIEKKKRIIQNGIETEGIIFGFETSISYNNTSTKYPVIRFVTHDGIWITQVSDYGVPFLFKKGQKVKVIYDRENPKDFIFRTSIDISNSSYLFLIIGIILFIIGVWFGYEYLSNKD